MNSADKVGERLVKFRESLGFLKQSDFLTELQSRIGTGISQGNISHWEAGKYIPKRDKLALLKSAFPQLNTDWLLEGTGNMLTDSKPVQKFDNPFNIDLENVEELRKTIRELREQNFLLVNKLLGRDNKS